MLFAGFVLFLLFFVFIFAEIEDLAHWRVGVRRYLDEVETGVGGHGESLVALDDPNHIAALVDQAHTYDADLAVDPGSLAGGGEV